MRSGGRPAFRCLSALIVKGLLPDGFRWRNRHCGTRDIYVEKLSVKALPKVVGFAPIFRFPPTGIRLDRVGWD